MTVPVPGDRPAAELLAELEEDLDPWLQTCGACDAGLPMDCTHPDGDYRNPMSVALGAAEELAGRLARAEQALATAKRDAWDEGAYWVYGADHDPDSNQIWWDNPHRAALRASQGGQT